MKIRLVGMDPALSNLGIAIGTLDLDTMKIQVDELRLISTEGNAGKTVRKNSDDLRRAKLLRAGMMGACEGASFAIAEIPTGTQSARGAMSNGIALGILAGCPIPLIEVVPNEVKLATVGDKKASKEQMIAWAAAKHPNANWNRYERDGFVKGKGGKLLASWKAGDLKNDNEHLADACAVLEAGIRTNELKAAIALMRGMRQG